MRAGFGSFTFELGNHFKYTRLRYYIAIESGTKNWINNCAIIEYSPGKYGCK
jgi:hypothetical protein